MPLINIVRRRGRVNWFSDAKGFGFITPLGGGRDVFVHYSAIESDDKRKSLPNDAIVEFDMIEAAKGPIAGSVRVVSQ